MLLINQDQDFQKTLDKIAKKHWDVEKEKHPLKWLGNVMRLSIKMALLLMRSLQNMMIELIARDPSVKVAHKN